MKQKKLRKKLALNKSTVADLKIGNMSDVVGGADTYYPDCFPGYGSEGGGDTCVEFCRTVAAPCESAYFYCPRP